MTPSRSSAIRRALAVLALLTATAAMADNVAPELYTALPARSFNRGATSTTVDLLNHLRDPDVTKAARINFKIGTATKPVDIAFYETQAPVTVANFIAYITSGRYANNILHRSAPGFVIQGGGFYFVTDTSFTNVPTYAAIVNEYNISNTRGTLAMAKLGTSVNSATSQWFINLADNSANLNNQNGGFAVFARVLGNGMAVADEVAAITTYNATSYASAWDSLPLTVGVLSRANFIETNTSVISPLSFTVTSSDPSVVAVSLNGSTLQLTPSTTNFGTATVTVTTTDLDGAALQSSFIVNVVDTYAAWKADRAFANATVAAEAADADADGVPNLHEFAFGGDPLVAAAVAGAPRPESGGGVVFNVKRSAALTYTVLSSDDLQTWTQVWTSTEGL